MRPLNPYVKKTIRERLANGERNKDLAAEYRVTPSTITRVSKED